MRFIKDKRALAVSYDRHRVLKISFRAMKQGVTKQVRENKAATYLFESLSALDLQLSLKRSFSVL